VTGGSSRARRDPPGNFGRTAPPGWRELPSVGKRLRRLLLRWQAPQPAPPTASSTSPGPTRGTSRGYVNPYGDGYVNPYVNPSAPAGVPGLAFGVGVPAGRSPFGGPVARKNRGRLAPLGGEVRAHLIHPTASWLYGSRLRRRSTNSAVRLPHGALAILCAPTARRHLRWRSIPTMPRSRHERNVTTCNGRIVAPSLLRCDDLFSTYCCDDPMVTYSAWVPVMNR